MMPPGAPHVANIEHNKCFSAYATGSDANVLSGYTSDRFMSACKAATLELLQRRSGGQLSVR